MTFSAKARACACLLLALMTLAGCIPSSDNAADEEKEPHFLEGKRRVSEMDYSGAIASYERALQVNPNSSAAHFELGWLYDQKENDPAAAIYHYSQYLKFHSQGDEAERARACIAACKQELAKDVSLAPVTRDLQKQLEQLTDENKQLKAEVERWRAYYKSTSGGSLAGNPISKPRPAPNPATRTTASSPPARTVHDSEPPSASSSAAGMKTHVVRAGETPAAIARKYGIRVESLMSANPRLDARHLQIGQSLVIPPR
ncbi:MAG TPA: LysM peptidoglycan-binding domain-containing protein [Verrucomicrobiae bacterium]|nr:LysM peptidoglycan-binding domain-containing protein [Verrucomicrobiae bacterium]